MKGYYITNLDVEEVSGVSKKIRMQISAIEELNHNIELISYFKRHKLRKLKALTTRLPFFPLSSRWDYNVKFKKADFIYIRYPLADKWFISFLKRIKFENPTIKLIVEIATFPYEGEIKSISKKMRFAKDKSYRSQMKDYVDLIVTSSKYNEIFGIPTIKIDNGIDVNFVPIVKYENNFDGITLATVSSLSFWQGFDRVIEGLHDYYKENNSKVRFIIIGDGGQKEYLYKLADKYGFIKNKIVIFTGEMHGKALDNILNEVDVGIGCIGLHRKNMSYVNTLKVREYCARGIPFVIANEEGGINEAKPFVHRIHADDSPVDIKKVVAFHKNLMREEDFRKEMREYAKLNLSWEIQMKKVFNEIG